MLNVPQIWQKKWSVLVLKRLVLANWKLFSVSCSFDAGGSLITLSCNFAFWSFVTLPNLISAGFLWNCNNDANFRKRNYLNFQRWTLFSEQIESRGNRNISQLLSYPGPIIIYTLFYEAWVIWSIAHAGAKSFLLISLLLFMLLMLMKLMSRLMLILFLCYYCWQCWWWGSCWMRKYHFSRSSLDLWEVVCH